MTLADESSWLSFQLQVCHVKKEKEFISRVRRDEASRKMNSDYSLCKCVWVCVLERVVERDRGVRLGWLCVCPGPFTWL